MARCTHSSIVKCHAVLQLPARFPGIEDMNHTGPVWVLVMDHIKVRGAGGWRRCASAPHSASHAAPTPTTQGGSLAALMFKQLSSMKGRIYSDYEAFCWAIDVSGGPHGHAGGARRASPRACALASASPPGGRRLLRRWPTCTRRRGPSCTGTLRYAGAATHKDIKVRAQGALGRPPCRALLSAAAATPPRQLTPACAACACMCVPPRPPLRCTRSSAPGRQRAAGAGGRRHGAGRGRRGLRLAAGRSADGLRAHGGAGWEGGGGRALAARQSPPRPRAAPPPLAAPGRPKPHAAPPLAQPRRWPGAWLAAQRGRRRAGRAHLGGSQRRHLLRRHHPRAGCARRGRGRAGGAAHGREHRARCLLG
jgi:hypothetical protein